MSKLKVASFFAGSGGIDVAFELTKEYEIIYANEFDSYPASIYDLNHKVKTDIRDIHLVEPNEVPDCDVIIGGFPCTSFSIAGYRKGFEDERSGDLFFE
jgi:DNA (cytosine-5)-methyltransferase 1